MRSLPLVLSNAQKSASVRPAVIITVGDVAFRTAGATGSTTTCHNTSAAALTWTMDEGGRILKVKELESPYKQTAEITLNNYDRLLFDLILKGERLYIGWGVDTMDGPLYSTSPVMWVKQQLFYEAQGIMQCKLNCVGIMDLLNSDTASEKYIDDGTTALGDLVIAVLTSTLDCFDHCKVYNVVLDDALDDLWTGVYLGESFSILKDETRAHVLARLFDMTHASMRPGSEAADGDNQDTIHIFTMSQDIQSEYTLERSGHRFYVDSDSSGIVMPNEIIIKTPTGYSPAYTGRAIDATSHNTNPCTRIELVAGLISSNQAQTIANTMLANIINAESGSSAFVPMNCGTEIFDKMKVYSKRSGRTLEGNVGSITRLFDPLAKEPRYDMSVGFGKWFDPRAQDDSLGYGYGFVGGEATVNETNFGHTVISASNYYSKTGTWLDYMFAMYGSGVLDDSLKYKIRTGTDTYTFLISAVSMDGVTMGNVVLDFYIDDVKNSQVTTGPGTRGFASSVLTEGVHTLELRHVSPQKIAVYYWISVSTGAFVPA